MSICCRVIKLLLLSVLLLVGAFSLHSQSPGFHERSHPWTRHTIDDSLRGADGIRLSDINKDGRLDLITGWEEGGVTRAYLQPQRTRVHHRWPSVSVGPAPSVEDAVFVDLDGDGAFDAVSATEGGQRTIFLHRFGGTRILDPDSWTTAAIPDSQDRMQWMYLLPLDLDQDGIIELAVGGKNENASIGWFKTGSPNDLDAWKWHPLREAGWIMSLIEADVDSDSDPDIVFTDRRGERSGAYWLENPGGVATMTSGWGEHLIGGQGEEIMFATLADLDQDGRLDLLAAVKPRQILYFRRKGSGPEDWETFSVAMPEDAGTAKAVAVGDIDRDGQRDLVFTCEHASEARSGVMWMSYRDSPTSFSWETYDISGPGGTKFDLIRLIDLDRDGDLDALTCEETEGLGIIWYENPVQ